LVPSPLFRRTQSCLSPDIESAFALQLAAEEERQKVKLLDERRI
jgi:hypothetical protein